MAKQTFTTGDVLTAAAMTSLQNTAMLGGTASAKTANYTLVAADAGTAITMSNAGATTITVNTGLFAAGDTVTILNIGAGTCTITAGTATVSKPTNASLGLIENAGGVLYFTATGAARFMPFDVGSAASSFKGARGFLSANQTLTAATFTKVNLDSETYDVTGLFNTTNGRLTPTTAGYWLVFANITTSSGTRSIGEIRKNGNISLRFGDGAASITNAGSDVIYANGTTDYFELYAYIQGPGGSLSVLGDTTYTMLGATFMGA